ncbi:MAG: molecular chaperone TorD family protein [Chloroflexi bacterium]|nr:molecular chaperone TorD family protein [Chloroflexota bacterium]
MLIENTRELCRLFARVMDYPTGSFSESAATCCGALEMQCPAAAAPMLSFASLTRRLPLRTLEEAYTQAFDLDNSNTLYLGYHLFGDGPKRSSFLIHLHDAYAANGVECGGELGDHLCVMLRFLGVTSDFQFTGPLLEECMVPTLGRIEKGLQKDKNQYWLAVRSLWLFLEQVSAELARTQEVHR